MDIVFNSMPVNLRDPGVYVEIAAGPLKGLPAMPSNTIMFGQMLASGSAAPNVPVQVWSANQAIQLFGLGSMLARMCAAYLKANAFTPLWVCPQVDAGGGTAAIYSATFGGSPTVASTQPFYIDGVLIQTGFTADMTPAQMATALVAAIADVPGLPVTAAVDEDTTSQVNFTCLHKGADAGVLDFRPTFYTGDNMVPGVTLAIANTTPGAGNPSVTAALAAIAAAWYLWWINPYTDGTSTTAMADAMEANWGPTVMKDSIGFMSQKVSLSAAASFGEALNEKLWSYMPAQNAPQAPYLWAAIDGGITAYYGLEFRPFDGLVLTGLMPPALADQWTGPERNMLDYDGVANFSVNDSGQVTVARQITTYINNAQDVPDTTFLDVDDVIRAAYLRYSLRVYAGRQWPRYTIADDDTQLTVGVAVTTPSLMKASFANLVKQWEAAGLITDAATTIANMVVQRNQTDATRADILMPVTPVKGLHVQAAQIQLQQ